MLKILQARLQQYMNHELPDVQAGFRKCRGARDQIAIILWIIEKAREFQKNIYFCFIDYAKPFDCVDHNKLWKILQEMGRVNVDILAISELKWTGMGEFNSDDHYIYYCGQESLRRNGVAIMVNKRV